MKIPVTTKNIAYLGNIARRIADEQRIETGTTYSLPPFQLNLRTAEEGICTALTRYVDSLNMLFSEANISFSIVSELHHIMSVLEENQKRLGTAESLRLFGIICSYPFIGPQTIHLDLTNSCNTDCIYCWWHSPLSKNRQRSDYKTWQQQHLSFDTIKMILEEAEAMDVQEILLTGQGEPLTHPQVEEIMGLLAMKPFHTTIFTNGKSLTERSRRLIAQGKIDILYISFSASSFETYKAIHPSITEDSYQRIVAAIKETVTLLQKKAPDTAILFCFVINRLNMHECLSFLDLAHELGMQHVRFQLMDPIDGTKELLLTDEQRNELPALISKIKAKGKKYDLHIVENIDIQKDTVSEDGAWDISTQQNNHCFAGWYFARPWTTYELSFCCAEKAIGSLHNQSFKDIWTSERYQQARRIAKSFDTKTNFTCLAGNQLLDDTCSNCGNYEYNEKATRLLKELDLYQYL